MNDDPSPNLVEKTVDYIAGAGDAARQAGQQVRQAGATAMDEVKEVSQEASQTAKSALGTLKEQARTVAETEKARVADGLAKAAQAVHRAGESLESQQDWFAHLIERGADEVSEFATGLRGADIQTLTAQLSSFARRRPALFLGASMAVGFALTRMGRLAATAPSNGDSRTGTPPAQPIPLGLQLRPDVADAANVVDTQGVEFGAGPVAEANRDLR
jgi:hypothetical protein